MYITTKHCIIRDFLPEDAEQLHEVLSNAEVMEYIEPPFTPAQTTDFIKSAGMCEPPLVYALLWKETGTVIGHVIFHRYETDSIEIGWILHKEFWGHGIAGEVTARLVEHAREIGARSCVIECDPLQSASKRIARKYGFLYEGQDEGCDVYRLAL